MTFGAIYSILSLSFNQISAHTPIPTLLDTNVGFSSRTFSLLFTDLYRRFVHRWTCLITFCLTAALLPFFRFFRFQRQLERNEATDDFRLSDRIVAQLQTVWSADKNRSIDYERLVGSLLRPSLSLDYGCVAVHLSKHVYLSQRFR